MTGTRFLLRAVVNGTVGSRSMFTSSKHDYSGPRWFRVGLAFGSTALLWALLFKEHSTDVQIYKERNGLE